MNLCRYTLALAWLTAASSPAWGHGFTLSLAGNQLALNSENPTSDLNPLVFVEDYGTIGGVIQADHGWAGGGTVFASNRHFSFSIRGPLWYSDGGTPVPAAPGVVLTLIDQQAGFSGQQLKLTGATGSTAGFPTSGKSSHEMIWKLTIDTTVPGHVSSVPDGVYGLMFRVSGGQNGGGEFIPSPYGLTAMATPGFDPNPLNPNPNIDLAAMAIYTAAIPEPSTIALALFGFAAACFSYRKRAAR